MPSSACGTGSPCCDSNRKKWQYLWIVLPRNRKYQSMTRIGPCSARSSSPVSSATSRRAASAGGSPTFRWPFGNPQLRYESRIRRNRGAPSGPRRNTTPPAEVSRWARRCLPFMTNAERGSRNAEQSCERGVAVQSRVRHEQAERAVAVRDARHHAVGRGEHPHQARLVLVRRVHQVAEVLRRRAQVGARRGGVVEDRRQLALVRRRVHAPEGGL